MAAEWLRAAQVAAQAAGHHEVLTTFTDLTGRTHTLREGGCARCGARWPCLAAQWAAQDGRWRALVGELLRAYTTYITSREATDKALAAGEARVANASARTEQAALEQLRATLAEARQVLAPSSAAGAPGEG